VFADRTLLHSHEGVKDVRKKMRSVTNQEDAVEEEVKVAE